MNNGKVRIYELSRELDLENKDILAICDRLSIAAKSHSSTIGESEATQIRTAAESYTPTTINKPPKRAVPPKATRPEVAKATPPVKKQQILEIRRHRSAAKPPEPPAPEAPAAIAAPQEPAVQPTSADSNGAPPAAKPASAASSRNLVPPPSRPRLPSPVKPTAARPGQAPKPEAAAPAAPPKEAVNPAVETAPVDLQAPAASEPPQPSPELVKPPARPVAKRPEVPSARRERSADSSNGAAPNHIPITEVDDDGQMTMRRPKPMPELKRPKPAPPSRDPAPAKTSRTSDDADTDSKDDITPGLMDDEQRLLRRPTLPKTGRRRANESEDEERELRQRNAAKAKAKRRSSLVEEDEELEEVSSDETPTGFATPAQLNVSLARPPKPKSMSSGPSKPAASAPPRSRKFGGSSGGGGGGRSNRRDRRNREEEVEERVESLLLTTELSVNELADQMKVPDTAIIKALFMRGIATNVNQTLDIPTIRAVAEEFEVEIETAEVESEARKVTEMLEIGDMESLQRRPPVVTIMGHVDHGKTTLLDSVRKAKVAQGEAGGITQHIGAYHVDVEHNGATQQLVFLDTPGHEAFTAMRARGTRVTDIAILVVAADDGVRPQTIEAISHARAAEVPIVVAINKIDKEGANPDRVKQELMEHGLVAEEWGGDTIMVAVSALNNQNLDELLEMLLLVAEVEDLQANPDRLAKGTVIEANLDKARGPVATLLIQNGTLRVGDSVVVGPVFGKVRAMIDDRGHRVDDARPSFAVEVLGLNEVPAAGDEFEVFADEKVARATANDKADQQRQSRLQQSMASRRVTLSSLSAQAQEGDLKELNLLLKADVQGSVEAILGALQQLPQGEVQIRVLLAAAGEISETDVDLAAASGAVIIGFNTSLASGARQAADQAGVDVRDYDVIYQLLEDIQGAMEGLLDPEMVEEPLGQVEVRAVFPLRRGSVAGCYVLSGKVNRNCRVRVFRGSEALFEGNLDSLKRMKEDAKEVAAGFECGIAINSFNSWQEGDKIEAFRLVSKRRTLAMA
jgi:translation initiation factor IF-2